MNFFRGFPSTHAALLNGSRQSRLQIESRKLQGLNLRSTILGIVPMIACLLLLSIPSATHAQSTFGSVRGTVQDSTGAAIPGTQLVLHSVDENTDRTFTTDSSGNFLFENVKAGQYSLKAHHEGFADTVTSGISVEARQDLRLSATLNVSNQATTIEVSAGADQINTGKRNDRRLKDQYRDDTATSQQSSDHHQPVGSARTFA